MNDELPCELSARSFRKRTPVGCEPSATALVLPTFAGPKVPCATFDENDVPFADTWTT